MSVAIHWLWTVYGSLVVIDDVFRCQISGFKVIAKVCILTTDYCCVVDIKRFTTDLPSNTIWENAPPAMLTGHTVTLLFAMCVAMHR